LTSRTLAKRPGRLATLRHSLGQHAGLWHQLLNLLVTCRWMKNSRLFLQYMGRAPRYIEPRNWTDKMQWRKVFDRNPLFRVYADKVDVRQYIESLGTTVRCPEFLWVGSDPDRIPFDSLSGPYVVKPAIASGQVIMVRDPRQADETAIKAACKEWLAQRDYGLDSVEWGYWGRTNRILIEEFLPGLDGQDQIENWKFFVFGGRVGFVQLESKKNGRAHLTFFNREGERMPIAKWVGRLAPEHMDKPDRDARIPDRFADLVHDAELLAGSIDHVRVDLYNLNGETWFSELTPYDGAGYSFLYPEDDSHDGVPAAHLDGEIGALWQLPPDSPRQFLAAFLPTSTLAKL